MRDNAGFQLWNMSKRISDVMRLSRETGSLASDLEAAGDLRPAQLAELRSIAESGELLAAQADETWARLRDVADVFDPGLVEATGAGPAIIHNHGDNRAAANAVREVLRKAQCVEDAVELAKRLDDLLIGLGIEPRHIMGAGL